MLGLAEGEVLSLGMAGLQPGARTQPPTMAKVFGRSTGGLDPKDGVISWMVGCSSWDDEYSLAFIQRLFKHSNRFSGPCHFLTGGDQGDV